MFRVFFYFFPRSNNQPLHHCIVTTPNLPVAGELISLVNLINPNYEGFVGKVGRVIRMLTASDDEGLQNNFLVLVRISDFIENNDILTLVVDSESIPD